MEGNRWMEVLLEQYPSLGCCKKEIQKAYGLLVSCYKNGSKLLVAGNGGSAADAEHIVGELMKGFKLSRKIPEEMQQKLQAIAPEEGKCLADKLQGALPAIALDGHIALSTAYLNDVDGTLIYSQQVYGYGHKGDLFLAISTSGNSENVLLASITAKAKEMKVIGLTGESGGRLQELADVTIAVPGKETYQIQELHLPVYHCLCLMLEEHFFGGNGDVV